jgi:hypothetical protein
MRFASIALHFYDAMLHYSRFTTIIFHHHRVVTETALTLRSVSQFTLIFRGPVAITIQSYQSLA